MAKKKSKPAALLQRHKEMKDYFRRLGHPESDMNQLMDAISEVKLTLTDQKTGKEEKITVNRAVEVLGEETFLSGISRSAFHATATRCDKEGKFSVYFNLLHWW